MTILSRNMFPSIMCIKYTSFVWRQLIPSLTISRIMTIRFLQSAQLIHHTVSWTTHLCSSTISDRLPSPAQFPDQLLVSSSLLLNECGPCSSVGIATELRSGRSGIESRLGRDFPPVQTGPGAHKASCKMGTGSFPGGKVRPGCAADHSPPSVPRSWKIRAIPLPTLWATPGL